MLPGQLNMLESTVHSKLVELEKTFSPSVLTQVQHPLLEQKKIQLWVKRDDLIHPIISGNKWRKLKYILDDAFSKQADTIISMGGAYSNHLHALAYVGKQLNLKTIGYIRGERPKKFSPTLQDLQQWGMELRFVSRTEYRELRNYKQFDQLPNSQKGEYWLPEGGATALALKGVAEIITEIDREFDILCVPCGTGTTLAGLIEASSKYCKIYGFSALKGGHFLIQDVEKLLTKKSLNWDVLTDYHFGGFAKSNHKLLLFIENFLIQQAIGLEQVYTGKMFYGLFDLIQQDFFKPEQKIIAIHTGGLQGRRRQ